MASELHVHEHWSSFAQDALELACTYADVAAKTARAHVLTVVHDSLIVVKALMGYCSVIVRSHELSDGASLVANC